MKSTYRRMQKRGIKFEIYYRRRYRVYRTEIDGYFISEGHEIVILTRKPKQNGGRIKYVKWLEEGATPENEIGSADGIINLAGVSINEGRWTLEHQKQIYDSRMKATEELIRIIEALPEKPSVLINASAIGIYPASLDNVYTEDSTEIANDFLARTVMIGE